MFWRRFYVSKLIGHNSTKTGIASSHPRFPQFLIAIQILNIELTRSQQTRKHFLIATKFDISASVPHLNHSLYGFLTATDPNSENWQSHENTRETIF
jgi:hypothetical protein